MVDLTAEYEKHMRERLAKRILKCSKEWITAGDTSESWNVPRKKKEVVE
jgi:hypothetical protein